MTLSSLADRDLAARCVAGEESAWVELVRRHDRKVLHVLWQSGIRDELDDLRQEVWARLLARDAAVLRSVRGEHEGSLGLFLARVARTVALDHQRARRRRPAESAGEELEALPHAGPNPEGQLRAAQDKARVLRALEAAATSARDRDLGRLHFEEGYSALEIAAMGVGLEVRGVEALLRRLREKIEAKLREEEERDPS